MTGPHQEGNKKNLKKKNSSYDYCHAGARKNLYLFNKTEVLAISTQHLFAVCSERLWF